MKNTFWFGCGKAANQTRKVLPLPPDRLVKNQQGEHGPADVLRASGGYRKLANL
jgi:hypothetical protein